MITPSNSKSSPPKWSILRVEPDHRSLYFILSLRNFLLLLDITIFSYILLVKLPMNTYWQRSSILVMFSNRNHLNFDNSFFCCWNFDIKQFCKNIIVEYYCLYHKVEHKHGSILYIRSRYSVAHVELHYHIWAQYSIKDIFFKKKQ